MSKKKNIHLNLHGHSKTVRLSKTPIACPACQSILLPKDFGNHCRDNHDLNPSTQCIWCEGQFTWPQGTKHLQADHLIACYGLFRTSNRPPPPPPPPSRATTTFTPVGISAPPPVLLDLEPLCEPLQFFGHRRLADLPLRAFSSTLWTTPYDPIQLTFQCESLNAACGYVRRFLNRTTASSSYWCHAMVKACAFGSFLRAMDRAGGEITALPFSCWCNGGPHPEARFRQHRHFILVASHLDEATFKKRFWSKVKVEGTGVPSPRFPCKRLKKIESALHLVNTIGYLSRRESRCKFSFDKKGRSSRHNHFHIFKALPREYKLPLVLGWDGGILELLRWEKLNNVKIDELAAAAADGTLVLKDGSYRRAVRHFFGGGRLGRGLVLPVNKRFVPTGIVRDDDNSNASTAAAAAAAPCLHLTGGRRLVFEEVPRSALDDEEWVRLQAERGNVFYDLVGDEWWTPKSHHQAFLKCLVPVVEENAKLKRRLATLQKESGERIEENAELKRRLATLQKESGERIEELEVEIERLKKR